MYNLTDLKSLLDLSKDKKAVYIIVISNWGLF